MANLQPQSLPGPSGHRALGKYILAGIIGALAACLAISSLTPATTFALPELGRSSADGVFAVEARLGADVYGLYLIDTKNQTILLYRYGGIRSGGLSLLSARSFRYDRQLPDFNSGKPSPGEVRELIETARKSPEPPSSPPEPTVAPPEQPEAPE